MRREFEEVGSKVDFKSKEERFEEITEKISAPSFFRMRMKVTVDNIEYLMKRDFVDVNFLELIKKQIEQAKEQNVDMIVACMHWGTEYRTTANSEQKELADFLFKNGVDIILGNHPHVLEPMEKKTITLEDGTMKDVFVVYALGNFTADQRDEITRDSAILNLNITKQLDGSISINKRRKFKSVIST